MHFVAAYLLLVGGFTAGVQVVRGTVRGVGKLIEGQHREALGEVAGGLVAPLKSAYTQVCRLGEDVCRVVGTITAEEEESGNEALPMPVVQRRAIVTPAVDGAPS